jgi:hypothetical protein
MPAPQPLGALALGDVLVLPDGRAMTIRAQVDLPFPAGSMAAFTILGEMDALLSTPASANQPLVVYVPIDYLPEAAANARVVAEGATNYWAPHLPALQGAMGEVLYRVVLVRGSVDPIVIVYRGPEVIVFIRAALADPATLGVLRMERADTSAIEVARHAARVTTQPAVPAAQPARIAQPLARP